MAYTMQLLQMVFILGLFAAGLMLLLKKLKKGRFSKESSQRMIRVKDGITIGMGQSVYLLHVNGQDVLYASNSSGVHMIPIESTETESPVSEFDQNLRAIEQTGLRNLVSKMVEGKKGHE